MRPKPDNSSGRQSAPIKFETPDEMAQALVDLMVQANASHFKPRDKVREKPQLSDHALMRGPWTSKMVKDHERLAKKWRHDTPVCEVVAVRDAWLHLREIVTGKEYESLSSSYESAY